MIRRRTLAALTFPSPTAGRCSRPTRYAIHFPVVLGTLIWSVSTTLLVLKPLYSKLATLRKATAAASCPPAFSSSHSQFPRRGTPVTVNKATDTEAVPAAHPIMDRGTVGGLSFRITDQPMDRVTIILSIRNLDRSTDPDTKLGGNHSTDMSMAVKVRSTMGMRGMVPVAMDTGSQPTMVAKKGKDMGPPNMVMILMMWKRSIAIISIIFATTRVSNSDGEWLNVLAAHYIYIYIYIYLNKAEARSPCCVRLC